MGKPCMFVQQWRPQGRLPPGDVQWTTNVP